MKGTLGENINVTADLVRVKNDVEGNYEYMFSERDNDSVLNYYGKMIELNGKIYKNDSVKFKEGDSEDFTIKGVWGVDFFNGKWKIPGEDDYLDMLLKEYYPGGSLPFKVYYLKSDKKLVPSRKDSPTASIELVFIYPAGNFVSSVVEARLKRNIAKSFFGEGISVNTPVKMMRYFEDEYYRMYDKNVEDWKKLGGASFNWEMIKKMTVRFNSDYLLCLKTDRFAYSGGAHGLENISYDIYDLKTGKRLGYNDIFKENSKKALTDIITKKMIKSEKDKSIYFVDTIAPNENVYVAGNGLGFQYSHYEIAPYAFGLPKVFLEFDEVKDYLKPGTIIYKMATRQ